MPKSLKYNKLSILSPSLTILTVSIGILIGGCTAPVEGKSTSESAKVAAAVAAEEEVLVPVHASFPERKDISAYFETTTRVQAERRVDVLSKGIGECLEVKVEEGDEVKAGQTLAILDKEELEAALRQLRVSVEQQKVTMTIADRSLAEGIASQIERDNAHFAYEQAQATLHAQEVKLDNQIITAPISGVVTAKRLQQGMVVASGMPTFSIVDTSSFNLPINPPEKELQNLQIGQKALVSIDSVKDREFETTVGKINPSVDPLSGTVKVTLEFSEDAKPFLREASFARVKLVMNTHEKALVVPKDALLEENGRKYVMVVNEVAAEKTDAANPEAAQTPKLVAKRLEVKTGLEDSTSVEVTEGISDDTRVITLGQNTLKDGAKVVITDSEKQISALEKLSPEEALAAARDKKPSDSGRKNAEKILRRR